LLLWLSSRTLDEAGWEEMRKALGSTNYFFIFISMLAGAISHLIRAVRWNMMIHTFGYRPKLSNSFFAVMIGYLANIVFFRMGEVMRCGFMARYDEPPADKLFGTVITERVIDLLMLIILMAITLLTQYQLLSDYFYNNIWTGLVSKFQSVFGDGLGGKLLLLGVFAAIAFGAYLIFKRLNFWNRFQSIISGVIDGVLSVKNVANIPLFVVYTLGIWLMYFLMVYLAFDSMEATSHLGLAAGLAILVFGSVGIIVVQGGLGAYHIIVQQILVLFGLTAATGFAFAWVIWSAQTLLIVILGVISFILMPNLNKKSDGGFISSTTA